MTRNTTLTVVISLVIFCVAVVLAVYFRPTPSPDKHASIAIPSPVVDLTDNSVICEDLEVMEYHGETACSGCPSYTTMSELVEPFTFSHGIDGSFSKPDTHQKLMDTFGCEPHSNSFGGALLLESNNGQWQRLYYQSGIRLNDCLSYRTENLTELLVCNEIDIFQGQQFGLLSVLRITDKRIRRRVLLEWYADEENGNAIRLENMMQSDINHDEYHDLSLKISIEGEFLTRLQEMNKDMKLDRGIEINFLYLDKKFTASERDQKLLRLMHKIIKPDFSN